MRSRPLFLFAIVTLGLALDVHAQGPAADVVKADVNGDLIVDSRDLLIVRAGIGRREGNWDTTLEWTWTATVDFGGRSQLRSTRMGQQVPVMTVHINEIESNGGVPGDWIELRNTGRPVDLSGYLLQDNDDTHVSRCRRARRFRRAATWSSRRRRSTSGWAANDAVRFFNHGRHRSSTLCMDWPRGDDLRPLPGWHRRVQTQRR